jgi:hypothetical protein
MLANIPTLKGIIDFWILITNLIHDQRLETKRTNTKVLKMNKEFLLRFSESATPLKISHDICL